MAAGYVMTELTLSDARDPLRDLLEVAGLRENFRLLTTGNLSDAALDAYAEFLTTTEPPAPDRAGSVRHSACLKSCSTVSQSCGYST